MKNAWHEPARRALHETRSGVVAIGAVLKMLRERVERLEGGAGDTPAQREIDLLARTAARLDELLQRTRALLPPLIAEKAPRAVELPALIARLVERRRPGWSARGLRVTFETPRTALVEAPVDLLVSLLNEFLQRIGECTSDTGRLDVRVTRGRGRVVIAATGAPRRADAEHAAQHLGEAVARVIAERLGASLTLSAAAGDGMMGRVVLRDASGKHAAGAAGGRRRSVRVRAERTAAPRSAGRDGGALDGGGPARHRRR